MVVTPDDALFKRYCEKIESIHSDMNYQELVSFQWPEEGTFTHRKASEALAVTKKLLDDKKFERDYHAGLRIPDGQALV